MRLIEYIAKARAARRAGYKMREVSFGMTLDPKGEVVWDGQIYEAATGREICPFALQPCEWHLDDDNTIEITFFQKNSNIQTGTAACIEGNRL
jgi:hypothetical protein